MWTALQLAALRLAALRLAALRLAALRLAAQAHSLKLTAPDELAQPRDSAQPVEPDPRRSTAPTGLKLAAQAPFSFG